MLTVRITELIVEYTPAFFIAVVLNSVFSAYALQKAYPEEQTVKSRLCPNPLTHLDFIGTLFPIGLVILGTPMVFGWSKTFFSESDSTINSNHKNRFLASISGIMGNLIACLVVGLFLSLLPKLAIFPNLAGCMPGNYFIRLLFKVFSVNLSFFLINFLPIPPFTGSELLMLAGGKKVCDIFSKIHPYSVLILLAIVFSALIKSYFFLYLME